jgi:hypothetical protein
VYTETFSPTSNAYGLVNIEIGSGNTTDDFSTIDWSAGPYFIETAMDATGGTAYVVMGTSQLMSVPYALYAKTSGNGQGPVGPQGPAGTDGTNGTNGNDGATGPQGLTGNDGAQGLTGPQGPAGADGTNGTNGTDGATGLTGPAGADGQGGVIQAGTGVTVAGAGTVVSPYVVSTTSLCGLSIGDTYQGGIIFYLDASGCHGLISALSDQSSGIQWHNGSFVATAATFNGVKAGQSNTRLIVDTQGGGSYAAQLCNDLITYTNDGLFEDWYLPSRNELSLMRQNIGQGNALGLGNIGNFSGNSYWNSTEGGTTNAGTLDFSNGTQYYYIQKNLTKYVRGVRAF